jgi:predicted permease
MFTHLMRRIAAVLRPGRLREELDEEMAFHIDALTEDLVRQGMSPEAARREAVHRFGSREAVHDRAREERGLAVFDETARNLHFAFRTLARSPLFTTTFVLTLALCIASGTAVFSVADAVLWRALPYPASEQLAHAVVYDPSFGKSPGNTSVDGRTWELVRDEGAPLRRAVYSGWGRGVNLSTDDAAAYVLQQRVGAEYFATLGVSPAMGREFAAAEDVPGGPPVAILSHRLWERTFRGDPEMLGSTIRLKGEEHTVVGILPADFRSPAEADVWTPLQPSTTGEGSGTNYAVLVRIPEGMSFGEAEARLSSIDVRATGGGEGERRIGLVPLDEALNAGMRMPLVILMGGVLLMLVVGVSNLAGLQIARALSRRAELATRHALGGGASALVRQIVVENVVLGVLGGVLGLAMASALVSGLEALVEAHFGLWQEVRLDARAVLTAVTMTAVATLAFGLAPVGQVLSGRIGRALRSGTRTLGGGGHRVRKVLLVGQVAMVTTMLFAAGLLIRSYGYLEGLDPGFDAAGVTTLQLSLEDARFAEAEQVRTLFDESLREIRAVPGVASAAVSLTLPYERALNMPYRTPDSDDPRTTNAVYVTPGFFEALDIPVLAGRAFDDRDREDAAVVAVVNRAFAEQAFGGNEAVGRQIRMSFGREPEMTIVGVVGNVQQAAGWGGDGQPVWETPTVYLTAAQGASGFFQAIHIWFAPSWIVRAEQPGADIAPAVTRALLRAAPDMPTARVASLEEVMADAFSGQRFEAAFLLAVAVFALLLAGIGLYGIVAHEVLERRAEMGLRMALGANPSQAVWSAGSGGLRLTMTGVAVGAVLSYAISGVMRNLVFGVTPEDPLVAGGLLLIMTLLAITASFLPAGRVGRLDPALVLRDA